MLPQRELFSHGAQTATASIFVKTRNGAVLTREQIAAIQHLIAAAVPQLQPNQVSIVDDRDSPEDMRLTFEQTQARKIEDLLSQTLGFGKARAQVSADLDFDRVTTSSEIFDPESQVIRSTQSTTEQSTNSENTSSGGPVSVANNLPANPAQVASNLNGGGSSNKNNHTEETVNYEINKTVRNQVRESGSVKRLSVAVVVDGSYKTEGEGKDAKTTYVPRSDEEMKKIRDLVASAVNIDNNRGDTIEVVNMQFAQGDTNKEQSGSSSDLMGVPKADLFHAIETIILAVIGLLVVLLVVRPILRRVFDSAGNVGAMDQQDLLTGGSYGGNAQLPAPGGAMREAEIEPSAAESEIERMIDISRVEGRVKASSLRKVGEIVDKNPDEAVSVIRNWMYQESR